jgi:catechol 2,3-dioxygenase-like lactoylglutathione lyase family enzyme
VDGVGRLSGIALECPDPAALAAFYSGVLGWPITFSHDDWYSIGQPDGGTLDLSFQRSPDYRPPVWPDPSSSMQMHLHVRVADLDQAEAAVLELGATKAEHQPNPDTSRVFLDPAGHPFCLVPAPDRP